MSKQGLTEESNQNRMECWTLVRNVINRKMANKSKCTGRQIFYTYELKEVSIQKEYFISKGIMTHDLNR